MAKIDVERKGSTTPWGWIIGIIVLILILIGLWALLRDGEPATDDVALAPDDTVDAREGEVDTDAPEEVQNLGAFVREGDDRHDIGLEHEYANEGLHSVADAIDALAQRRQAEEEVSAQADTVRSLADRLQREEEALRHANFVREAGLAAAQAMEALQEQGDGADIAGVRDAANQIDPETQLLEQRDAMRDFFDRAHRALEQMSGQAGATGSPNGMNTSS